MKGYKTLRHFEAETETYGKLGKTAFSVKLPVDVEEYLLQFKGGDRTAFLRKPIVEYVRKIIELEKRNEKD